MESAGIKRKEAEPTALTNRKSKSARGINLSSQKLPIRIRLTPPNEGSSAGNRTIRLRTWGVNRQPAIGLQSLCKSAAEPTWVRGKPQLSERARTGPGFWAYSIVIEIYLHPEKLVLGGVVVQFENYAVRDDFLKFTLAQDRSDCFHLILIDGGNVLKVSLMRELSRYLEERSSLSRVDIGKQATIMANELHVMVLPQRNQSHIIRKDLRFIDAVGSIIQNLHVDLEAGLVFTEIVFDCEARFPAPEVSPPTYLAWMWAFSFAVFP